MNHIEKYFAGETFQCLIGIGISLVSMALAFYFLNTGKPMLKGMAYPFFAVSLGLLVICAGVVWRTPKDVKRVTHYFQQEAIKMKSEELPRMEKVMTSFKLIKRAEVVLGIIGIALFIFCRAHPMLAGIGLGLVIQCMIMLSFDIIAEGRGQHYIAFLRNLS